jgi:hypothetical protein
MPDLSAFLDEITDAVSSLLDEKLRFLNGFEDRLARSMQKALDIVTSDYEHRIRQLEDDVAKLLHHTGLDKR